MCRWILTKRNPAYQISQSQYLNCEGESIKLGWYSLILDKEFLLTDCENLWRKAGFFPFCPAFGVQKQ